jgi:hypothetical protein
LKISLVSGTACAMARPFKIFHEKEALISGDIVLKTGGVN